MDLDIDNTDVTQVVVVVKEEAPEGLSADVDQQDPEHHIKEEEEEHWTSLDRDQFHLKEEMDASRFPFTAVSIKSENNEEKPVFLQLHQQQIEDRDVPTSSLADQMTTETGGIAESSRNPDLSRYEHTSDSSETEVSGEDEDVNLEPELSESESKTGDRDNDWNKSRSFESDVETEQTEQKPFSCDVCRKRFDKNLI
ncbi:uncharacterized protein [Nothobranchius furzeri]|uniref:uncharacterized protein isoform X2 n=1 Tax=Nothobranchius furzeri TaxID=105023 RepID=UPI003904DB24